MDIIELIFRRIFLAGPSRNRGRDPVRQSSRVLVSKVVRTLIHMRTSEDTVHPSLAIVGILQTAFEDWLVAPRNRMCVFFGSRALLLHDFASSPRSIPALRWHPKAVQAAVGRITPTA
jgi:hypothetical protein